MQVLARIDAWDRAAQAPVTLRAASHDDVAVCHNDNETWWPALSKLPTLRYDRFDGSFSAAITSPSSSLTLQTEPFPDFGRLTLADARIRLMTSTGDGVWTERFDGRLTTEPKVNGGVASISFAVDDRWLDQPLLATYAGTTGAEGGAELKGSAKPLALGAPRYVPGKLISVVDLVFQVSAYGAIEGVEAALERLARLSGPFADYADYAALIAATVPEGSFATCLALGLVRLGAPPVGQISFLVRGDKAGAGGWARRPGALIKRLAELCGKGDRVDAASVAALDAARPYNLSLYLDEQTTARQLIQQIAASVNAVAYVSWLGVLHLLPVALAAPTVTLAADGSALPPVRSVEQIELAPPFKSIGIKAERSWTVHALADIAFTATLIDRGLYDPAEVYREGNVVSLPDGSRWVFVAEAPASEIAPEEGPTWARLQSGPTTADGTPVGDAIDAINDPNTLTPAEKLELRRRIGAADARWKQMQQDFLRQDPPGADPRFVPYNAAVLGWLMLGQFLDQIAPPWTDLDVSSPVDGEDLSALLEAVEEALAALNTALYEGAQPGTSVGGVPVETLLDRIEKGLAETRDVVAEGEASIAGKRLLKKELAAHAQIHADLLAMAERAAGIGDFTIADYLAAWNAYVGYAEGLPNWADDTKPSPVDGPTYMARRSAWFDLTPIVRTRINVAVAGASIGGEFVYNARVQTLGRSGKGVDGAGAWGLVRSKQAFSRGGGVTADAAPTGELWIGLVTMDKADTLNPADFTYALRYVQRGGHWVVDAHNGAGSGPYANGDAFDTGAALRVTYEDDGKQGRVTWWVPTSAAGPLYAAVPSGGSFVGKLLLATDASYTGLNFVGNNLVSWAAIQGEKPPVDATSDSSALDPRDAVNNGSASTLPSGVIRMGAGTAIRQLTTYDGRATNGASYLAGTVARTLSPDFEGTLFLIITPLDATGQMIPGASRGIDLSGAGGDSGTIIETAAVPSSARQFFAQITGTITAGYADIASVRIEPSPTEITAPIPESPNQLGESLFGNERLFAPNADNSYPGGILAYLVDAPNGFPEPAGPVQAGDLTWWLTDETRLVWKPDGSRIRYQMKPHGLKATNAPVIVFPAFMASPGETYTFIVEGQRLNSAGVSMMQLARFSALTGNKTHIVQAEAVPFVGATAAAANYVGLINLDTAVFDETTGTSTITFKAHVASIRSISIALWGMRLIRQVRLFRGTPANLQALDPLRDDQINGVATVLPAYEQPVPPVSSYVNLGNNKLESWRAGLLDLPVTDLNQIVTVDSKVRKGPTEPNGNFLPGVSTVDQTATDKDGVSWSRQGRVNMVTGEPNAWGVWAKSYSTEAKPSVAAGDLLLAPGQPATPAKIDNSYVAAGANAIPNSEQLHSKAMRLEYNVNGAVLSELRYASEVFDTSNYALSGSTRNVFVHQTGVATGTADGSGDSAVAVNLHLTTSIDQSQFIMSCSPGERIVASAFTQVNRCRTSLIVGFVDASGTPISYKASPAVGQFGNGTANTLGNYNRLSVWADAPPDAVGVFLVIRKYNTFAGEADSYMWAAAPMLERGRPNQIEPSPYVPGPTSAPSELGYVGELDADSTINNIPFGYSPIEQVGAGLALPNNPFFISQPRYRGQEDVSGSSEWAAGLTAGLEGTLDNNPGSNARGVVALTRMAALSGLAILTSIKDEQLFRTLTRLEKEFVFQDLTPSGQRRRVQMPVYWPATGSVQVGYGVEKKAQIYNTTDWMPVTDEFSIAGLYTGESEGSRYSRIGQFTAFHEYSEATDNTCTIEYKLQRRLESAQTWEDDYHLGTSSQFRDRIIDGSRSVQFGNVNVTGSSFTGSYGGHVFRVLARLDRADVRVGIRSAYLTSYADFRFEVA